jgi:hypothetical protein
MERLIFGLDFFGPDRNLMVKIFLFLKAFVFELLDVFESHLLLFEGLVLCELFSFEGHLILFFNILHFIEPNCFLNGLLEHFPLDNGLKTVRLDFVLKAILQVIFVLFFNIFKV